MERDAIAKAIGDPGAVTEEGIRALLRSVCDEHGGTLIEHASGTAIGRGFSCALTPGASITHASLLVPANRMGLNLNLRPGDAPPPPLQFADAPQGDRNLIPTEGVIKYVPAFEEFDGQDLATGEVIAEKPIDRTHRWTPPPTDNTTIPKFVITFLPYDWVREQWGFATYGIRKGKTKVGTLNLPVVQIINRRFNEQTAAYDVVHGIDCRTVTFHTPVTQTFMGSKYYIDGNMCLFLLGPGAASASMAIQALVVLANTKTINRGEAAVPVDLYNGVVNILHEMIAHVLKEKDVPVVVGQEPMLRTWVAAAPNRVHPTMLERLPAPAQLICTPIEAVTEATVKEMRTTGNPLVKAETELTATLKRVQNFERALKAEQAILAEAQAVVDKLRAQGPRNFQAELNTAIERGLVLAGKVTRYGLVLKLPELRMVLTRGNTGGAKPGVYTRPESMVVVPWGPDGRTLDGRSTQVYAADGYRFPHMNVSFFGAGRACWGGDVFASKLAVMLSQSISAFASTLLGYLYEQEYVPWTTGAKYQPFSEEMPKPEAPKDEEVKRLTIKRPDGTTRTREWNATLGIWTTLP
jgi:hypothetical protein